MTQSQTTRARLLTPDISNMVHAVMTSSRNTGTTMTDVRSKFKAAFKQEQRQLMKRAQFTKERRQARAEKMAAAPSMSEWRHQKEQQRKQSKNWLGARVRGDQRWLRERRSHTRSNIYDERSKSVSYLPEIDGAPSPSSERSDDHGNSKSSEMLSEGDVTARPRKGVQHWGVSHTDVLDSDYVRKVGQAAQRRLQLQEANKLLAGATLLEHWQAALAAFGAAVEADSTCVRALTGVRMCNTRIEAATRQANEQAMKRKKMALLKLRYGDDWRAAMVMEQTCDEQELRAMFNLLDTDGSGMLDREEFAGLASYFSDEPLTEVQVDEAMATIDADASGQVDFDELYAWFMAR